MTKKNKVNSEGRKNVLGHNSIVLFHEKQVRRHWDNEKELWYFSIIDVLEILTESENPQVYWRVLKKRLLDEGSNETVTKCNGLKMKAKDGKMRVTDVADTETLLRLIQSIPSPKAEPLKLWLARIGYERIEETEDPELAIDRAMQTYLKKGYSKDWINQRVITTFNISGRYQDEKFNFYKKCTKNYTEKYLQITKELNVWLKKQYLKK